MYCVVRRAIYWLFLSGDSIVGLDASSHTVTPLQSSCYVILKDTLERPLRTVKRTIAH